MNDLELDQVFPEDFIDFLFQTEVALNIQAPQKTISTQTENFSSSYGICVERFCRNESLRGQRCKAHHKKDIDFKDGVKICRMTGCKNEAYGRKYKCCEDHEISMGNISADVDFFSEINFHRCIVKRCYSKTAAGWRCNKHYGLENVKYKVCKITCYKEGCSREIYGKGYTLCLIHK